jgi:hypothetical protein
MILVKVDEIDRQGRVNLSRKDALKEAAKWGLSEADEKFSRPPVRPEGGAEPAFAGGGGGRERDRGSRDDGPRDGGYGGGFDAGAPADAEPERPRFRGNQRPPQE